eukprot:CAMPEP_0176503522 /NCGR_PEP_ID=MMETSP0200_2-20121128/15409_1 /TAXON_ID=947934 /ORGANISM="Chaetoceros sp., Strain GSL56" /LENGTH=392 /DNA_ID=CAMNT_0017902821 /DNA_START=154 /DNA_END=1332 /DNA_ORIENTATION=+
MACLQINNNNNNNNNNTFPIYNLHDFQLAAKQKVPRDLYEYLASGTDDEQTLAENRAAMKQWYLRPRVLRPVSNICTTTCLFGQKLKVPFFVSPAGVQCLCDPDGECATAKACGKVGTIFGHSQHATKSIEEVAQEVPDANKWYQLYILKDRAMTGALIGRAVQAGYKGIFLTVDSPRLGYREADARNGFNALPEPFRLANYPASFGDTYNKQQHEAWDQNSQELFDTNVTWDIIPWIKEQCAPLPIIVKGIHTAEDAILAVKWGADGVMVSNHGGRQLDGALATIDILPEIVQAVGGLVPVLIDGGFQRGTDILKALALGATAVGIGKPIFFALCVGGQEAVEKLFQMLANELEAAMALCGCASIEEISSLGLVTRHPSGGSIVHYQRAKL